MTYSKTLHVPIKALWAHLCRDPGQAHIQRMLQTANHVLLAPRITVPVLNGDAADLDGAGIDEGSLRADRACIQGGRHRKDFKNRAGFIRGTDGTVELTSIVKEQEVIAVIVQIQARGGCHCK